MPKTYATIIGKAVKSAMRLRGGGSALPGLVVETLDKDFISSCLSPLPRGVVLISGTNGKTTTTKMVVELLESQGLRVFTNRTGSNFTRGVAAALLSEITLTGELVADIAVLELDEAHAVHFVRAVKPRFCLLLNVMRDQLDRFGEIDATARLLETVAEATSEGIVINREDPRLLAVAGRLSKNKVHYFGLSEALRSEFPSDDEMHGQLGTIRTLPDAISTLDHVQGTAATLTLDGRSAQVTLKLDGIYNIYNAVAALTLVQIVMGKTINRKTILERLSQITPAYGRGETLVVDGKPLELILVKNPGGFRLGLKSFEPAGYATMIAINDNYADGRDMSWLWDVEFASLRPSISHVTGIRCYDMALRLQYDEVTVSSVDPNLSSALKQFIHDNREMPKRIYCTYTAMVSLRRELAKITDVEVIT